MKGIGKALLTLYIFLSLVLPTSVFALSEQKPLKMIEVKKLVWDEEHGAWNNLVYADAGDVLRFKIVITYHDPDGKGPSYKIKWISIEDHLPPYLEYLGNATLEESIISDDIVEWENISGVELFDGESFSLEYDAQVLDDGIHTNVVEVKAFETCPHVWHTVEARATVYAIDYPAYKDRDVDDDSHNETATDTNLDLRDGFEAYQDSDGSSRAIKTIDGDWDEKKDHFIDIDSDGKPDKYWDPDDDILSDVELKDVDNDTTKEWVFDSDGDGIKESYYDPDDDSIHLLDITPPMVKIIKPEEGYLYRNNIKIRKTLFKTKIIGPINIKVEVRDDSGIDRVEFYIDGKLKHVDEKAPYSWLWIAKPLGIARKYTIEVKAYDIYGNSQTDNITVIRLRSRVFLGLALLTVGSGLIVEKLISEKPEEPTSPPEEPPAEVNTPPVAVIDASKEGHVGDKVILNASRSYDPDGKIISYKWDFGDGMKAEGEVVSHVYKEAGRYTITLEVTDDKGKTDTAETYIEILSKEGGIKGISTKDGFMYGVAALSLIPLLSVALLILRRR